MKVYHSLDRLPVFRRAVITIGSFDGLHLGHQTIMKQLKRLATERDGESVVITFHPHPRQVVYPKDKSLKLLNTISEKIVLFEELGIDNVVVVPFDVKFSQQSADEYIVDFLYKNFRPEVVIIGYDHRFGLNRQGDINYLRWYGGKLGFEVVEIAAQQLEAIAISSTKVRAALQSGQVEQANSLLAYPYRLSGKVIKGAQIGRAINYPTANLGISSPHKLLPADGIYAARAQWGQEILEGMLYIGKRPSLQDDNATSIELHIFDFNRDIYNDELVISVLAFIRPDQQFEQLEDLQHQLAKDEIASRQFLRNHPHRQFRQTNEKPLNTAIVILNYNGLQHLQQFLPPLIDSLEENSRIVVVDNQSTDKSVVWLQTQHPDIQCLILDKNHGFAGGYNLALLEIKADIYVLLNSDVAVGGQWLKTCLAHFQKDKSVAAVQPKIRAYHAPEKFEYAGAAGGYLDILGYPFCRGRIFAHTEIDKGQYDEAQEIFWASGAALFIRAELFHGIGGFEADYFAHAEEIDLCWRLKRAGYRILVEPSAEVYHVGGATLSYNTPKKTYLNFRNTLVTSFKNESRLKLLWWLPLRLVLDGVAAGLFLSQGNWQHIGAIVRAHFHFYPRIGKWWKQGRIREMQIEAIRIGADRSSIGRISSSVVVHYYLLGHKRFSQIMKRLSGRNYC